MLKRFSNKELNEGIEALAIGNVSYRGQSLVEQKSVGDAFDDWLANLPKDDSRKKYLTFDYRKHKVQFVDKKGKGFFITVKGPDLKTKLDDKDLPRAGTTAEMGKAITNQIDSAIEDSRRTQKELDTVFKEIEKISGIKNPEKHLYWEWRGVMYPRDLYIKIMTKKHGLELRKALRKIRFQDKRIKGKDWWIGYQILDY